MDDAAQRAPSCAIVPRVAPVADPADRQVPTRAPIKLGERIEAGLLAVLELLRSGHARKETRNAI